MSSFKSYGKVYEVDQERLEARRTTRKRIAIVALSAIVLVGIIVGAVVGTSAGGPDPKSESNGSMSGTDSLSTSIQAVCKVTQYPDSCYSSLKPLINSTRVDPVELFRLSLQVAMDEVSRALDRMSVHGIDDAAINDCKELVGLTVDFLNGSLSFVDLTSTDTVDNLETWLSAAGTYIETCIDGLQNSTEAIKTQITDSLKNSTEFTSNSLAIVTAIFNVVDSFKLRRLMGHSHREYPRWVSVKDRNLLDKSDPRANADIVVAKDGSGKYKTITAALKAVPDNSKDRTVIYVKKGIYYENVRVEKSKWNVMMIGDGMNKTIVSGSKNFVDGTPTFSSATFAAFGKGFIARDMGFQNNAGAIKQQAVALMASSDQSVFFRCSFDAFQDTLYTHSLRQFYRECDIIGTVDFIFGNAAVILQNCTIRPRVPMLGQQDTITAQGKMDPNQNTGIVIHNCQITAFGNLTSVQTYLGRPWKPYSTTVYIQSMMGGLIDPDGWLPWVGDSAPDTIFYSEYGNYGPGSSTKNRVKWKGLRSISSKQATKFTVSSFISGDKWISKAGVSYKAGI
ncbi:putative pectinesterase/pectinesterase inhibitor 24 [Magnolia sinica]|uniref:putative pectinesterase/pectinesterase inhibitor 24 n=1 Tax=Magnolia sinica TaxID=86752 RepID=UPI002659E808|nr:putative pectinesterase/pectinesterase inhibitor 24 [Magnolia sinica]